MKNLTLFLSKAYDFMFLFKLLKMIKEPVELSFQGVMHEVLDSLFVLVGRERKLCVSTKSLLENTILLARRARIFCLK
mgnify:CR=1 FL=1